eukprot:scaffold8141_cov139-Skeletonema_dohrnii-CCMP3373.AAC.18
MGCLNAHLDTTSRYRELLCYYRSPPVSSQFYAGEDLAGLTSTLVSHSSRLVLPVSDTADEMLIAFVL